MPRPHHLHGRRVLRSTAAGFVLLVGGLSLIERERGLAIGQIPSSISQEQGVVLQAQLAQASEKQLHGLSETKAMELFKQANRLEEEQKYQKAESILLHLLESTIKELGPGHASVAKILNRIALLYRKLGHYSKAEPLFAKAMAITKKALGPDHPNTATSLNNLGLLYLDQSQYGKAEPLFVRALAIREKVLGPDHPDTVRSINRLAALYVSKGQYGKAEPLYVRALAIRENTQGPDHPDTARSLNSLANLYANQGLYGKAQPIYARSLAIREKMLGPDHPDTAENLDNLAYLYGVQGQYRTAEPLYIRALAIREKVLGPDHPDTATSLTHLALQYVDQGQYGKAEPLYIRALAIREKSLGPDHPDVAGSLNYLAAVYQYQGRYSKAEPLYVRALAIRKKVLGPDHPYTAISMHHLAALYTAQGQYGKAGPIYATALAIREKALGPDHPDTASSLASLANLYRAQGQYGKAGPIYATALAIREKALGPDHPDTASSLTSLAIMFVQQGQYSQAEPLYVRALAIREKALGPDHPDTAQSLNNLAMLYWKQSEYDKAESLQARVLAIIEKSLGPNHPTTALGLNNLAAIYVDLGQYSKAELLYLRSLEIRKKAPRLSHPEMAKILINLSVLHAAQGQNAQAIDFLSRGVTIQQRWLVRELSLQPSIDRSTLYSSTDDSWLLPFSLLAGEPAASGLVLSSRLNRHGLLQEIQLRQNLLVRASGPQLQLASKVTALNTQISSIALKQEQRQSLTAERDRSEAELYRQLPALKIPEVTPRQISSALPSDGALVEFQRYRPFDGKKPPKERWGSPRYLALILKPNGSIQAVPLGEAKPIEEAIANALSATSQSLADAPALWAAVSRLTLDPLNPYLAGSRQWFLSPDGELNRVPFTALPSPGDPSRTVGEAVQLRLITSGRDLIRLKQPIAKGNASLVMSNPAYNRSPGASGSSSAVAVANAAGSGQRRSNAAGGLQWAALPATSAEGQTIATLLGTAQVTGADATVKRLQATASPRVLHIATHGFFAPDQTSKPDERLVSLSESSPMLAGFKGEDPMLRSGLVLAGANQPTADPDDDGLLTASEATGLQLEGTELVVLSACSTGFGDIRTGEGVYGLQRALSVAGARSTLLSLWKVDDAATAAFMEVFYKRLKAGEGRAEALAATQADFRRHANPDWQRPYVWAAWQLTGDWRPIQGL